jgi:ankyrin repeat protein
LSALVQTRQVNCSLKSCVDNSWHWLKRLNQYFPDWQQVVACDEVQHVIHTKAYQALFISLYQEHFADISAHAQAFFQAVMEEDNANVKQQLTQSPELIDAQSKQGYSALHYAARYGRVDMLHLLLKWGANLELENNNGQSPLHIAASYNQIKPLNVLLAKGACPNKLDNEDKSPLYVAIASGSLDCAYALLAQGADPYLYCAGWNALHTAAWHGQLKFIKQLQRQGMCLNAKASHDGCTPLHLAAWNNQLDVVKYLLAHTKAINVRNYDGFTALHLAAKAQHAKIVALLIEAGAQQSVDNLGRTPLQLAKLYQYYQADTVLRASQRITCM